MSLAKNNFTCVNFSGVKHILGERAKTEYCLWGKDAGSFGDMMQLQREDGAWSIIIPLMSLIFVFVFYLNIYWAVIFSFLSLLKQTCHVLFYIKGKYHI